MASESTGVSSKASSPLKTPSALRPPPSDMGRGVEGWARRLVKR